MMKQIILAAFSILVLGPAAAYLSGTETGRKRGRDIACRFHLHRPPNRLRVVVGA